MAGTEGRLEIAWESRASLERAGYVSIGMDHFALPGDELAIASRSRGLHRNFQGYCTDRLGRAGDSQRAPLRRRCGTGRLPGQGGLDEAQRNGYLRDCRANVAPLVADGLAIWEGGRIRLTAKGHYASRAVASAFDPMLKPRAEAAGPMYSQAI